MRQTNFLLNVFSLTYFFCSDSDWNKKKFSEKITKNLKSDKKYIKKYLNSLNLLISVNLNILRSNIMKISKKL